jgi:hypothetical protein
MNAWICHHLSGVGKRLAMMRFVVGALEPTVFLCACGKWNPWADFIILLRERSAFMTIREASIPLGSFLVGLEMDIVERMDLPIWAASLCVAPVAVQSGPVRGIYAGFCSIDEILTPVVLVLRYDLEQWCGPLAIPVCMRSL